MDKQATFVCDQGTYDFYRIEAEDTVTYTMLHRETMTQIQRVNVPQTFNEFIVESIRVYVLGVKKVTA